MLKVAATILSFDQQAIQTRAPKLLQSLLSTNKLQQLIPLTSLPLQFKLLWHRNQVQVYLHFSSCHQFLKTKTRWHSRIPLLETPKCSRPRRLLSLRINSSLSMDPSLERNNLRSPHSSRVLSSLNSSNSRLSRLSINRKLSNSIISKRKIPSNQTSISKQVSSH